MPTHRWTHSTPRVRHTTGERIEQGDVFDARDDELRKWPDRIEPICGAETAAGGYCKHPAESCPVPNHETTDD